MFLFDTKVFEGLMRMRSNQSDINLEKDTAISSKVQVTVMEQHSLVVLLLATSIKKKLLDQLSEIERLNKWHRSPGFSATKSVEIDPLKLAWDPFLESPSNFSGPNRIFKSKYKE